MSSASSTWSSLPAHSVTEEVIPEWAFPFDGGTCGPDLEYDNAFLELQQAAAGKPETQFEAAVPPDWNAVESASTALLLRSRDLRLAVLWVESQLNLRGLVSLPVGLAAIAGLLENAWATLNPPLDEGDPYARLNVIESLGFGGSFYQSLRNCVVLRDARLGELRLRDFEVLTGNAPGADLQVSREQVEQYFLASESGASALRSLVERSHVAFGRLLAALQNQVEADRLPQLTEPKALLKHVLSCLPVPSMEQTQGSAPHSVSTEASGSGGSAFGVSSGVQALPVGIHSRAQALAAIDQVCAYLENAEPTNPAQLLLKRARRLIDKNFMQLMKDLAPDALAEVAKIMGVNPDSLEQDDA